MKKMDTKILFLLVTILTVTSTIIASSRPVDGPTDPPTWTSMAYIGCVSEYGYGNPSSLTSTTAYYDGLSKMLINAVSCGPEDHYAYAGIILKFGFELETTSDITIVISFQYKGHMRLIEGNGYNLLAIDAEIDDSTPDYRVKILENIGNTIYSTTVIGIEYTFYNVGSGSHYFYIEPYVFTSGTAWVDFSNYIDYGYKTCINNVQFQT